MTATASAALSTLSLVVVLSSQNQGFKPLFKLGYILLSMTPLFPVDDGSDAGHTNVAILITILQLMLLMGVEHVDVDVDGSDRAKKKKI